METHLLYTSEALKLLEQAEKRVQSNHDELVKSQQYAVPGRVYHHDADTSSSEDESAIDSQSDDSEDDSGLSSGDEGEGAADGSRVESSDSVANDARRQDEQQNESSKHKPHRKQAQAHKQKQQKPGRNKKVAENRHLIHQQLSAANAPAFPIDDDNEVVLPLSLLPKPLRTPGVGIAQQCSLFRSLSANLQQQTVVVLLIRSGRFAGGVFKRDKCLIHRACQRYTIRKGQGKAQSAQDNSKRKAKSMGAQLRRAGEISLKEDIHETLLSWKSHIESACLVLVSCPKTMTSTVFADSVKDVITRDDDRIRKVPFDIGRPTFESVCVTHDVMMHMAARSIDANFTSDVTPNSAAAGQGPVVGGKLETIKDTENAKEKEIEEEEEKKKALIVPLTPLHEAAMDGDVDKILEWLMVDTIADQINIQAGENFSTPLHFAAESVAIDQAVAAQCVSALLLKGHADPCVLDVRGRPPYFLAAHDKVREAFRMARGTLGEEYCDWKDAKVGPALTEDAMQAKKEKEAEKRRQKRARQKKKKAADKAQLEAAEKAKKDEEEKQKQKLSTVGSTTRTGCHWCNSDISRKPRKSLFFLHDFKFCSSDCVKKHKRAQIADAAMARMGL